MNWNWSRNHKHDRISGHGYKNTCYNCISHDQKESFPIHAALEPSESFPTYADPEPSKHFPTFADLEPQNPFGHALIWNCRILLYMHWSRTLRILSHICWSRPSESFPTYTLPAHAREWCGGLVSSSEYGPFPPLAGPSLLQPGYGRTQPCLLAWWHHLEVRGIASL